MTPQQFKVTNKAEYDDLMQTIERERPDVRWRYSLLPPTQIEATWDYPTVIDIRDQLIFFSSFDAESWKIGQSLSGKPTTLEAFCAIPENEDGSITIPSTLAVAIVKELRGGKTNE